MSQQFEEPLQTPLPTFEPALVHIYHDEVKPERNRFKFLAHGVLCVPDDYREVLLTRLSKVRRKYQFQGEVHYTEIRGDKGKQFQVAKEWLSEYFLSGLMHCPFKAFIVQQEGFQSFPYPGDSEYPEHAAHSLLTTFVACIAWSYSKAPELRLRPVFDASDNELDIKTSTDLPSILEVEVSNRRVLGGKHYPQLRVAPAEFVSSDPMASGDAWGDSELVQLCDLLLGGAIDAIGEAGRSPKTGRLRLARSVAEV